MGFFPGGGFFHESRETEVATQICASLDLLSIHASCVKVGRVCKDLSGSLFKVQESFYNPEILLGFRESFWLNVSVLQMHFIKHGFKEHFFGLGVLVVDFLKNYLHELSVKNEVVFFCAFPQIILHFRKAVVFSRA
jgi:hypothetical protein